MQFIFQTTTPNRDDVDVVVNTLDDNNNYNNNELPSYNIGTDNADIDTNRIHSSLFRRKRSVDLGEISSLL